MPRKPSQMPLSYKLSPNEWLIDPVSKYNQPKFLDPTKLLYNFLVLAQIKKTEYRNNFPFFANQVV